MQGAFGYIPNRVRVCCECEQVGGILVADGFTSSGFEGLSDFLDQFFGLVFRERPARIQIVLEDVGTFFLSTNW